MNNEKYEILEHSAELRLRIYGKTIEELFINAAEALADIQNQDITNLVRSHKICYKEKIKIKSLDLNCLLVDFLSEILAKSQINKCVYLQVEFKEFHPEPVEGLPNLNAELIGYPIERFDEDVKAVTYYGVDIKKNPQGIWQTEIVFDV